MFQSTHSSRSTRRMKSLLHNRIQPINQLLVSVYLKEFQMLLNRNIISKLWTCLPYVTSQRLKVRILPKEHYDETETPFMKSKKPGESFVTNFYAFVQRNWTWADIKHARKLKKMKEMQENQKYISTRHRILGPDLATAHFIIARGGKVKFKGHEEWVTFEHLLKEKIPSSYVPGFYVEELDASNLPLCYEGFENMCNLFELKKLILQNCPLVDDWCLNRSHLFGSTLEYLDISGCKNVSERGICTLHVLKNLKTLVIHDTPNIQHKELVSLLLQEILPNCEVIGVNYDDPILRKRIEKYMD
ncbi:distal membrane-arm assembly complex protein 2 [Trichonephila clavata]|uniref:ATP synthase subunit s-like protein n=1 Tax=Trichonephila clavata TaxID=2740835 RepID=A0A8X6HKL6_TRICU|nr:distal membrane-arm assembly complex protein 2 [Trichonephila clavata]